ncbi:hypothetical protein [Pseudonocardia sp.]|uniref:hypothetical protein n=1 Tax=Pseudonocardia sp. TaxID=60912 RepID=UPI003D0AF7FB
MTAESSWALIVDGGRAHRVQPAGGDGYWRCGCGVIVNREPTPAPSPDHPRCGKCVRQLEGSQANRPIINGGRR